MAAANTVKLIVVHDSEARAKIIAAMINKAGYAVKGTIVKSAAALGNALIHMDWDVVVVTRRWCDMSVPLVAETLQRHKANAALLVADHDMDEQARLDVMRDGAVDAVSLDQAVLFGLVLRREMSRKATRGADLTAVSNLPELLTKTRACSANDQHWVERIRTALEDDRFVPVYQPIVNLCAEPAETYEMLLRMLGDDDQEILPGEFLDVADKVGLMKDIDYWMIKRGVRMLVERVSAGSPMRFFVKLSAASLTDEAFVSRVAEILAEKQLPGERLIFEIAESDAIEHAELTRDIVKALKHLGCGCALDHVGLMADNGDAWAAFDVDYVKIGGQLICDLANNDESKRTVRHIAELAKAHKRLTIAQFVQDAASLSYLWQCGISYIQGYYLQAPSAALNYSFAQEE